MECKSRKMRLKKKVALAEHSTALVCVLLSVESLGLLEACYLYLLNKLDRQCYDGAQLGCCEHELGH